MQKTAIDIERDFYLLAKRSVIGSTIKGDVYRANMRFNRSEDCVVRFIAGLDGQLQTGVVSLNIYTDPIVENGVNVDDKERCGELLRCFYDTIEDNGHRYLEEGMPFDYILDTDGSPRINYDETTKQYVISCRIRYTRLDI